MSDAPVPDRLRDVPTELPSEVLDTTGPGELSRWRYFAPLVRRYFAGRLAALDAPDIDVDDLVAEALVRLYSTVTASWRERGPRPNVPFRQYLSVTLRNLLVDALRDRQRDIDLRRRLEQGVEIALPELELEPEAIDLALASLFDTWVQQVPGDRTLRAAQHLLDILSGCRVGEIAAREQISERAVRKRVRVAERDFLRWLERRLHPEDWQRWIPEPARRERALFAWPSAERRRLLREWLARVSDLPHRAMEVPAGHK